MGGSGQLKSELPGALCATAGKDGVVVLSNCIEGSATQKWSYDNSTQQLTTGSGLCVTASGSGPAGPTDTLVLGKSLVDNSFAVLFLNNKPDASVMTCDVACMHRLGAYNSSTFSAMWSLRYGPAQWRSGLGPRCSDHQPNGPRKWRL